ncbi:unnamed protein product [Peronospora farinosa]|uniref:Non-canonical E2 ubiquitin-conjugating enzyme C-terminal domain-containing protein n=1 Tax=Peronospora farinosa TaxID=134698 RepID=A0AAV0T6K0_9STRA|nr:unnamed protein product [Peronospora farinosa]
MGDEDELNGDKSSSEEDIFIAVYGTVDHSSASDESDSNEPAPRRNICDLMGHYLLDYPSPDSPLGYTDKLDTPKFLPTAKRVRAQLQDVCGFLSALAVASDYKAGEEIIDEKKFADCAEFFLQEMFELGRRYKIMNPEKCAKIRTVHDVAEAGGALDMLHSAPDKAEGAGIQALSDKYESRRFSRDCLQQCLYSIADNNYHLYFERDPIDRMIKLLITNFNPDDEDGDSSLAIISGNDGARLSHSHDRQYNYVLQSLTLWREIAHDMFRLWCLTDEDLLTDVTRYELTETGQGLHRIQSAPRVSRAMHVILPSTMRSLDSWVGSSVIRFGDKNVPNALMFIITTSTLFWQTSSAKLSATAERTIFSRLDHALMDDLRASAWNWCSNLHTKPFFPIFKITGFVGFDGKFG